MKGGHASRDAAWGRGLKLSSAKLTIWSQASTAFGMVCESDLPKVGPEANPAELRGLTFRPSVGCSAHAARPPGWAPRPPAACGCAEGEGLDGSLIHSREWGSRAALREGRDPRMV